MFGRFQIRIFVFLGLFLLSIFLFVSAYDAPTTHAGLSQEIVEYYQSVTKQSLSTENAQAIISGSILEDEPSSRVTRHFYDPVHNTGLLSVWESSKDWLDESKNEFAWSKGIDAYAKGDTKKAFEILGHSLHLLEDASVPDHTRNDPHASLGITGFYSNSPYENWTQENKDRATMKGLGKNLALQEKIIPNFTSPEQALDTMATFSNNNFFSKDTVAKDFNKPEISRYDKKYGYGKDNKDQKEHLLAYSTEYFDGRVSFSLVKEGDSSVMSDYFFILGPEAIKNGAGMVALFIKQGEEAKAKLALEKDPLLPTPPTPTDGFFDTLKKGLQIVPGYLKTLFQNSEDIARSLASINQALPTDPNIQKTVQAVTNTILDPLAPKIQTPQIEVNKTVADSPAFVPPTQTEAEARIEALKKANEALQQIQSQLVTYAAQNNIPITSPTLVTYHGGGGGTSQNQTVTPPTNTPDTNTGTTTDPVATTTPDITAPTFTATASDCLFATLTECTALSQNPTVSWDTLDTDVAYWSTDTNGIFATTTATSSTLTLTEGATTTFALSATDTSGNISATTTLSLFYPTQTVEEPATPPEILSEDTYYEPGSLHEFDTDLLIPEGVSLTIDRQSTLRFAPGKSLLVYGNLFINGYSSSYIVGDEWKITFDRKGDTGTWGGIYFAPTAGGNIYTLEANHSEGVVFDGVTNPMALSHIYLMDTDGTALSVKNNSNITLRVPKIEQSEGDGISVSDSEVHINTATIQSSDTCLSATNSIVSVDHGEYFNCLTGMSFVNGTQIDVQSAYVYNNIIGVSVVNSNGQVNAVSRIENNSVFGIYLENGTLDATNNYWGASSGPFHPDLNPEGQGDAVSDGVQFDPWVENLGGSGPE